VESEKSSAQNRTILMPYKKTLIHYLLKVGREQFFEGITTNYFTLPG